MTYKKPWIALPFPIKLMNINSAKAEQVDVTGNIRITPFSILIATQREMHQSKKAQRKNLIAMYKKDTPKFPPLGLSFGYAVDTN